MLIHLYAIVRPAKVLPLQNFVPIDVRSSMIDDSFHSLLDDDANAEVSSIGTVEGGDQVVGSASSSSFFNNHYNLLAVPNAGSGRESPSVASMQSDAESCYQAPTGTNFPNIINSPDSDGDTYGK